VDNTYALINADNSFAKKFIGNSVEWRGHTMSNLGAMTQIERRDMGVYLFKYPTIRPTDLEIAAGLMHEVDVLAGIVYEKFIIVDRPLVSAQEMLINCAKNAANAVLSTTDWMVVRAFEVADRSVNANVLKQRQATRDECAAYERAVLDARSVSDLKAIHKPSWLN